MLNEIFNTPEVRSAMITLITAGVIYLFNLVSNWFISNAKIQKLLQSEKLIEVLKKVVEGYILVVERQHPELSGLQREELVITMLVDYIKSTGLKNLLSDSELRAIVKTAYESILTKIGQERFDKVGEDNSNNM